MTLLSNYFVFKGPISWVMTNFLLVISNQNYVKWWFSMTFSPTEWNNIFQNWNSGTFVSSKSDFFPGNTAADSWTHLLSYFYVRLYKVFFWEENGIVSTKYHLLISMFFEYLNWLQLEKLFFNCFGCVDVNLLGINIKHLDIWLNCFFPWSRFHPAVCCSEDVICQAHRLHSYHPLHICSWHDF